MPFGKRLCIPSAVVMTEYTVYGRFTKLLLISYLIRLHTDIAEVHYTPVTLINQFHAASPAV